MPHSDPDERRAYYREWKKGAKKRLSNKFSDAARHANERAERFGLTGRLTTADVRGVVGGATCVYCGAADDIEIDHRIPMSLGGPNDLTNLVPACHSCNASKMRADRPRRWSQRFESCTDCGSTERRHQAHGRCSTCHSRVYEVGHPGRRARGTADSRSVSGGDH